MELTNLTDQTLKTNLAEIWCLGRETCTHGTIIFQLYDRVLENLRILVGKEIWNRRMDVQVLNFHAIYYNKICNVLLK